LSGRCFFFHFRHFRGRCRGKRSLIFAFFQKSELVRGDAAP
jgi:hypothetical protein